METSLPTSPPVGGATPAVFSNVRTWNILCHASALLGAFFHFPGHLLGPLIVWLAKRDASPEIDAHGKESLNFQISMLVYNGIAVIFCLSGSSSNADGVPRCNSQLKARSRAVLSTVNLSIHCYP